MALWHVVESAVSAHRHRVREQTIGYPTDERFVVVIDDLRRARLVVAFPSHVRHHSHQSARDHEPGIDILSGRKDL